MGHSMTGWFHKAVCGLRTESLHRSFRFRIMQDYICLVYSYSTFPFHSLHRRGKATVVSEGFLFVLPLPAVRDGTTHSLQQSTLGCRIEVF